MAASPLPHPRALGCCILSIVACWPICSGAAAPAGPAPGARAGLAKSRPGPAQLPKLPSVAGRPGGRHAPVVPGRCGPKSALSSFPNTPLIRGSVSGFGFLPPAQAIRRAEPHIAHAVSLDSTLGQTSQPVISTNLAGQNDYAVDAAQGKQVGGNVFFSFSSFSLATDESATFTSSQAGLQNILARVTGADPSVIDGTIRSTVSGANLFLMNPRGVMFGPHAHLELSGAFAVTTADYLRLSDGGRFDAAPAGDTLLTSGNVSAYGFLGPSKPAAVSLANATLQLAPACGFSVVAGDISLAGTTLKGAGNPVNLVSLGGAGEALPPSGPAANWDTSSFATLGDITLGQMAFIDNSGPQGGCVRLSGANLLLDDESQITSDTRGAGKGGLMDIRMRETVTLHLSGLGTSTSAEGDAGDLSMFAPAITFSTDLPFGQQFKGIGTGTSTESSGAGGTLILDCDRLAVTGGFILGGSSAGAGRGGDVFVTARESIEMNGLGRFCGIHEDMGVLLTGAGTGDGGIIRVTTPSLHLMDGAAITETVLGAGNSGEIHVNAGTILIEGSSVDFTGIASQSNHLATGHGGKIFIEANDLTLRNTEGISAFSATSGRGGDIEIHTTSLNLSNSSIDVSAFSSGQSGSIRLTVDGAATIEQGQIAAIAKGSGDGGQITLRSGSLSITGNPQAVFDSQTGILAQSYDFFGAHAGDIHIQTGAIDLSQGATISASTAGNGPGGNIDIQARRITIRGAPGDAITGIAAQTNDDFAGGPAGKIKLEISGALNIRDGGQVRVNTFGPGAAGNLAIHAGSITISGRNEPTYFTGIKADTKNRAAGGAGGSILLEVDRTLRILDGGVVSAGTLGSGRGGSIEIHAPSIELSGANAGGRLTGISTGAGGTGSAGDLQISAGKLSLTGGAEIAARTTGIYHGGSGGNITIGAQSLTLAGGGRISASTTGSGQGGQVDVTSGRLSVRGKGSGISADTAARDGSISPGTGEIKLTLSTDHPYDSDVLAQLQRPDGTSATLFFRLGGDGDNFTDATFSDHASISIDDGSAPSTGTFRPEMSLATFAGRAANGQWRLVVGDVEAEDAGTFRGWSLDLGHGRVFQSTDTPLAVPDADGTFIASTINVALPLIPFKPGRGGDVRIQAGNISLTNGASISARTSNSAAGGNVTLLTPGTLKLSDHGRITATTRGPGAGGNITIKAGEVSFRSNGAAFTGLSASSTGAGRAGDIAITAGRIALSGEGARVSSTSQGSGASGAVRLLGGRVELSDGAALETSNLDRGSAGSIDLLASDLRIVSGSISSAAALLDAGEIFIRTRGPLTLQDAVISTDAGGNGGSIHLTAGRALSLTRSAITAAARGAGGNIQLDGPAIKLLSSRISANAVEGHGGVIGMGMPATGVFGDARDFVMASPFIEQSSDSRISASSTFGIQGTLLIGAPFVDLASSLENLQAEFFDASTQLRDHCARKMQRDFSSFLTLGAGGLEVQPEEPGWTY